jgi:hypothetical protein
MEEQKRHQFIEQDETRHEWRSLQMMSVMYTARSSTGKQSADDDKAVFVTDDLMKVDLYDQGRDG